MKIIKPYGQTRVQEAHQRYFYRYTARQKDAGREETNLAEFLQTDQDALIAVWVSTIDKVFGKPVLLSTLA